MNFFLKLLLLIGAILGSHHFGQYDLPARITNLIGRTMDFVIFAFSVNLIFHIILFYYRRRKKMSNDKKDNITTAFENVYLILLFMGFVFFALRLLGIDINSLFTSLSIVAAAIAIVFKDFLSPIIAGFLIAFSRELNIDDYIQVGDHKGRVIDLSLSKLSLLSEDDDLIVLPNDTVYSGELINYTRGNVRKVSINFDLSPAFAGSLEELEDKLIGVLAEYHDLIEPDSFNLKILNIHKDYLDLKFQYILTRVDRVIEKEIRKKP
jgi:small-conductance mechanosensitive channel